MTRPSKRPRRKSTTTAPGPERELGAAHPEERHGGAEVSRAEAEVAREEAERSRALAEEGREVAEEVRRSAESLRLEDGGDARAARQGRLTVEKALRAEAWFKQRFEVLLDGVTELRSTLTQLRQEAAELRQLLSDTQQALKEEQIIAAERRATQQRMDRERFGERS